MDVDRAEARALDGLKEGSTRPQGQAELGWLCLLHGRGCAATALEYPPSEDAQTPEGVPLERAMRRALLADGRLSPPQSADLWLTAAEVATREATAEAGGDALASRSLARACRLVRAAPDAVTAVLRRRAGTVATLLATGSEDERVRRAQTLAQAGLNIAEDGAPTLAVVRAAEQSVPLSRRLLTGLAANMPLPQWATGTSVDLDATPVSGAWGLRLSAEVPGVYHVHATVRTSGAATVGVVSDRELYAWLNGERIRDEPAGLATQRVGRAGSHTLDVTVEVAADGEMLWVVALPERPSPGRAAPALASLAPGLQRAMRSWAMPDGENNSALLQWFPRSVLPALSEVLLGDRPSEAVDRLLAVLPEHAEALIADAARHVDAGNPELALRRVEIVPASDAAALAVPSTERQDSVLLQGRALAALGLTDLAADAAERAAAMAVGHCPSWAKALELAVDVGQRASLRRMTAGELPCRRGEQAQVVAAALQASGQALRAQSWLELAARRTGGGRAPWRRLVALWAGAGSATPLEHFAAEDTAVRLWLEYQMRALTGHRAEGEAALGRLLVGEHDSMPLRQRSLLAGAPAPWATFVRDGRALAGQPDDPQWAGSARTAWLLDQEVLVLLPGGGALRRVHQVVRVISDDAADDVGEIRVAQGAELEFARTILADGSVVSPADIADKETISLRAVEAGAAIEFAQVVFVEPEDPATGATRLDPFALQAADGPTRLSEYIILAPPGLQVSWTASPTAPAVQARQIGVWTAYIFRTGPSPRARIEPRAVRPDWALPSVQVAASATLAGTVEPWDERLESAAREESAGLLSWVEAARRQPEGKARWQFVAQRLARGIQQSHDGGPPGSPAAAIAQQRGDRAAVFYTLARKLQVPVCMVRVRPLAREPALDPPDPLDLGMELERLTLSDGEHWYDPALQGGLLDHLRSGLRGRPGLLAGCGRRPDRRVTVPNLGEGQDRRLVQGRLRWQEDGEVLGEFNEQLTGAVAAWIRQYLTTAAPAERESLFGELAKGVLPGAEVTAAGVQGLETLGGPLSVQWSARLAPDPLRSSSLVLGMCPSELAKDFAALPARAMPLLFGHDQDLRLEMTIESPARPIVQPAALQGQATLVQWSRETTRSSTGLQLIWHIRTHPGIVAPGEYLSFAETLRGADAAEQVRLER